VGKKELLRSSVVKTASSTGKSKSETAKDAHEQEIAKQESDLAYFFT
jgi:hypothetical protein